MKYFKYIVFLSLVTILQFCLSGCISDDDRVCPKDMYVRLKAIDISGKDMTDNVEVTNTIIYVYNRQGQFLRSIPVSNEDIKKRRYVNIGQAEPQGFQLVVWANNTDKQKLIKGQTIEKTALLLKEDIDGYMCSPDDLHYGFRKTSGGTLKEDISISRKNSRVNIKVKGLPKDAASGDYFFTIRQISNGYDFKGNPLAGPSDIKQAGVFNDSGEFVTGVPINVIHYPQSLNISHAGLIILLFEKKSPKTPIASAITDSNGNIIIPKSGETLNILIEIKPGGTINIHVIITPWDELYDWSSWE